MIFSMLILTLLSGKVIMLNSEIEMILDVISFYKNTPGIIARSCWGAPLKNEFTSKLNMMTPPKSIQFIRDIEEISTAATTHNMIIMCDTYCPDFREFLSTANSTYKFRSPYRWLLITKSAKVLNDLKKFNILIDSDVLISERNGESFSLYLPYKLQSNSSKWKIESFGTWNTKHRLNYTKEMYCGVSMRRKNLDLLPVVASLAITNNSTKESLFSLIDSHIDLVTKAGYRQLLPLYQFMNATPVLLFANTWGYLVNGSMTGMLGDISRGKAELAGKEMWDGAFFIKERLELMQYLSVPSIPTVKFVFRQPLLSYQNNLFILPFKPEVWFCIFGLIIIIFVAAFLNVKWESIKMEKEGKTVDKMILRSDKNEIAMIIIGAITQQGSHRELKGTLGRGLMFIMFFVFLFLYTSYSANIVALLQSTSNQIKTLSDLLNSKLEMGVDDTPYNRHFFQTATDPVKKAIYEKKIAAPGSKPNFMGLHEGVLKLQKKPFAFHMFLGSGYNLVEKYFLEHEKCGLQEIAYIDENRPWQSCGKNSSFKEIFKIGLFRNLEHGINSREIRLLFAKKPSCSAHGGIFDSVYMRDFYPALMMLAYGMALSIVLLMLEIFHWQQHNKRKFIH